MAEIGFLDPPFYAKVAIGTATYHEGRSPATKVALVILAY